MNDRTELFVIASNTKIKWIAKFLLRLLLLIAKMKRK
jgi:hypothetical protein